MNDQKTFKKYMALFAEKFDKELTTVYVEALCKTFKPYGDEECAAALHDV